MQTETIFRYRGRVVTAADVEFIRDLIAKHPGVSRRRLSVKLCEALDWRQANGALRDMVCRGLMLSLHRLGHIELPAVAKPRVNPFLKRASPALIEVDRNPIEGSLGELPALTVQQVRRSAQERLFNSLMQQHHYLGYRQPVEELT